MGNFADGKVYEKLGVRPMINAVGNSTMLGGSTPSDMIKNAMEEASHGFVDMGDLTAKAGDYIAGLLGTEAAYPTSGCAAAMTLSSAVVMTGNDVEKMGRLPDTTGMKNEILIQSAQRYAADPCFRFAGAKLVEVGNTAAEIEAAVGENTAAIAYVEHPQYKQGALSLEETTAVARKAGVPVIVDAAAQIYPVDYFRRTAQAAELVCFSSKYYGGPNSAGFVTGKRELIDAIAALGFQTTLPYSHGLYESGYAIGRGMKLDRQEIAAVVVAIDHWFTMNHEDRLQEYDRKMAVVQKHLEGVAGVRAHPEPYDAYFAVRLHVTVDPVSGTTAQDVADELDAGNPRIRVGVEGDDLIVVPHTLNAGEEAVVGERLRTVIAG